ncbi:nucleoside permease [Arcticibacterium luteifluviistationis]|uniref:MFS transporter n=1 Tax=Arcticibacterium luteifluviistationis TaxID=1784714 RepID=A0A2Z4G6E4_9BACT|nr:nucleoside permease [Arcticibacterium luteifluviistationis]AWV96711.1 MFS transporter [Arcticibacterium luteifluviistationis]
MKLKIKLQLSSMMFLQFFIWGVWYVTMGTYLIKIGFDGLNIGAAYSTINWGAIISPFVIGMIADRFFSAERVLGIMHLTGGVILYILIQITDPATFFWTLLVYALLYMPTLALVNTICFNQMTDTKNEFPRIRVLGTLGWITSGLLIGWMKIEDSSMVFQIGAAASILLGIYSFFLPSTPPQSKGQSPTIRDILGLDALALLKDRNFAVFIVCSLLISIPLAFYYSFTNPFLNEVGMENAAGKMTLGQGSEFLFLLLMPFFFSRLGVKKMLLIAMLAWITRYLFFAYGNNEELVPLLYMGIILHGICYDFFFVTGQIYVDQAAPKKIKASAQGFITLITYGLGMLIGSWAAGWFVKQYTLANGNHLWQSIWLIPAGMALIATLLFLTLFSEKKKVSVEN